MIQTEQDLHAHLYAENRAQATKHVYKYTDCGAWVDFKDDYIRVGSIVEGADFGTCVYKLAYPFKPELYDRCIEAIEAEADAIWKWANEEDGEHGTPAEQGIDAPDVVFDYPDLESYRYGMFG